jgi:hypothetical protein
MNIFRNDVLRLAMVSLALTAGCGPIDPTLSEEEPILGSHESLLTEAQKKERCNIISAITQPMGITNTLVFAGVANHETGLAQCWSEATWACQGPASSSCGGGPVIAGSGDGACSLQQGGLGMYQFDSGTYSQTLSQYGNGILTTTGNARAGVDYIMDRVLMKGCGGIPSFATRMDAIDWVNTAKPGTANYNAFIDGITQCYNGCLPSMSCYSTRKAQYDADTRALLTAFGSGYWYPGANSDPSVSTWGPGRLDVFVRGSDNALWHRWYDSGTWYAWQSLGGTLASGPDAVSWGDGRIDVFARDNNNNVVHKYYVGGTGWSAWVSEGAPPGGASSDPSVVSWGSSRLDVFVRGSDNALWHKWFDSGTWYGWQSLGGILTSAPDASTWGPGRIDVFARDTNNNIVQKYYAGGGVWSSWMQRGSSAVSASGAVSWAQDRIDVFARGSDDSLIHQYWNGSAWSSWISEGGTLTSGPDVTSWGPGRLDVVVRDVNNRIVHKWFVSGTGWSGWESLGAP